MKKNLGVKTALYPMPVLIIGSYDENGGPDAMNAAWGGIADDNQINICLSPEHKTVSNILKSKAFTVHIADSLHVAECDYLGIASGNKVSDKIEKCGFHVQKSSFVNAPVIDELPMVLECSLISYDEKSCRLLGEIKNVAIEESAFGDDGKIQVEKLSPITYDCFNHDYIALGKVVGKAFSDGKRILNK